MDPWNVCVCVRAHACVRERENEGERERELQTVLTGNVKNSVIWIHERNMQVFTKQL
jgi:putative SOS response-associated peptidase YedK